PKRRGYGRALSQFGASGWDRARARVGKLSHRAGRARGGGASLRVAERFRRRAAAERNRFADSGGPRRKATHGTEEPVCAAQHAATGRDDGEVIGMSRAPLTPRTRSPSRRPTTPAVAHDARAAGG